MHLNPFLARLPNGTVLCYPSTTLPKPAYDDDGHSLPKPGHPREAMSVIHDVHISYSGPQFLDDLTKTIAQVVPSLQFSLLPIYVLRLMLRWLLAAPSRGREVVRQFLWRLKSRMRRQSRLPRLYFVNDGVSSEEGWLDVRCEEGVRKMAFRDFVRSKCPSLFREYRPSRMLFKLVFAFLFSLPRIDDIICSGHLQTAFSAYGDFSNVDRIVYDR